MTTAIKETFEIQEPEQKTQAETPTRDDLKAKGWSAKELDAAEKRGMVRKDKEKEEEKKEEEVPQGSDEKKPDANVSKEQEQKKQEEQKRPLPDFTFKTPEQEKVFLEAFGPGTPQRAMYFRMKNERQARQKIEQEKNQILAEKQALEARIAALEAGNSKQIDEEGNVIDPDDKPLTLKQLRELQKLEAEAIEKQKKEFDQKAESVVEAQRTQEDYARSIYPDFDETVEKAKEVMKKIDDFFPDKWQQAKVVRLIRDLQVAAAKADQIDLDDYHAAHIAYEIGKLHPDYGTKADPQKNGHASDKDGKSEDPKKANGGRLTPEQMKRIEENTQRRASSASVQGSGGKRAISAEDVDTSMLSKMGYAERQRFREKYPERYAQLLRG